MAYIQAKLKDFYFDKNTKERMLKDDILKMERYIKNFGLFDEWEQFKRDNSKLTQKNLYNSFFSKIQDRDDIKEVKILLSLKGYQTFGMLEAIDKIL